MTSWLEKPVEMHVMPLDYGHVVLKRMKHVWDKKKYLYHKKKLGRTKRYEGQENVQHYNERESRIHI